MIQLKTILKVIDNSGAQTVECIRVLTKGRKGTVGVGTVGKQIVVAVKSARAPGSDMGNGQITRIQKGQVGRAVIVRAAKEFRRPDGRWVKFDDNACVMVNMSGTPVGSRITGPVAAELRKKKWAKIIALAPEVI